MRIINCALVLVLAIFGSVSLYFQLQPKLELADSHWSCSTVKKEMTNSSHSELKQYQAFNTLNFETESQLKFNQKGVAVDLTGKASEFEVGYSIEYHVNDEKVTFQFQGINWITKGNDDFVQRRNHVIGSTFEYVYEIHNNYLFLTSITNSEDSNYVCFRAEGETTG